MTIHTRRRLVLERPDGLCVLDGQIRLRLPHLLLTGGDFEAKLLAAILLTWKPSTTPSRIGVDLEYAFQ